MAQWYMKFIGLPYKVLLTISELNMKSFCQIVTFCGFNFYQQYTQVLVYYHHHGYISILMLARSDQITENVNNGPEYCVSLYFGPDWNIQQTIFFNSKYLRASWIANNS